MGSSMERNMLRVPLEIVNSRCCVRSALALRSALLANRLTLRSRTKARPTLAQASVWRGRRAQCATSQSIAGWNSLRSLSRMLCTDGPPSVGFFQLDEDAIGEQGKGNERDVEHERREIEHALGDAIEVG